LDVSEIAKKDSEIISVDADFLNEFESGEEFLGFEPNESTAADIETAEFVVAAGRGAASDQAWNAINELSDKFGGAIAYSRSFIDTGRVPDESCMIGTSGKSVKPKVLINAGISGAAQYVCGIGKSRTIISINKEPKAAIFGHSDYGVVVDVDKILPALLEQFK
jgi:electron transfer flavoprotein alpha subunit